MSRPIYEPSLTKTDAQLGFGSRQLFRRPPQLERTATLHIKVYPDIDLGMGFAVEVGDGKFIFAVSEDMDGLTLTNVQAYVTTTTASDMEMQIRNVYVAVDMLSTLLRIDAYNLDSGTSSQPAVIDVGNATVSWMDQIAIDVDLNGAGDAWGLGVILEFS